ncbi:MAG: hypothetical protein J6A94_11970 [Lachnospiraceae bacterium]|nr:hypothetical protein [Lachnospiraceae bacterium]
MNWKKNAFSYILWLVYTVAVAVCVLGVAVSVCYTLKFPLEYGLAIAPAYLLVIGLLVLGTRKLWKKLAWYDRMSDSVVCGVVEALAVVGLLALGIYLRVDKLMTITDSVEGMVYFDAAHVAADYNIPQVVHGATYIYLYLLHSIFLLLGNKLVAAVSVQIFLQILAAILLYCAIRKLSGSCAGVVVTAFMMLSPYLIKESLTLSPVYLFLTMYAVGLLAVSGCLKKNTGLPIGCLLTGILIGIVTYMDLFGITLLCVMAGVSTVEREAHSSFKNSRVAVFLFAVLGTLAGFFGAILADALISGKAFVRVLAAWGGIYAPGEFTLLHITSTSELGLDAMILIGILAVGIFSFWCCRHYERQGIWIAVMIALIGFLHFQMLEQNVGCIAYVYIFAAILAGIAVEAIFVVDVLVGDSPFEKIQDLEALEAEKTEAEEIKPMETKPEETKPEEPKKVKLLDNPLPLPKKHEPKVMDFKLTEVEGEKDKEFDFDIDNDDDFDIL